MNTEAKTSKSGKLGLTAKILIGMLTGLAAGVVVHYLPQSDLLDTYVTNGIFEVGGAIFMAIMKMLVVPVVLVSLVCGICNLGDPRKLGRIGVKTLSLYLLTTSIAITLGLTVASVFKIGKGSDLTAETATFTQTIPSLKETLTNIFPTNPFAAMVHGNMLQVIVFALLLGASISLLAERGKRIATLFADLNVVLMKLIVMLIHVAPYGVFCLLASLFAKEGFSLIGHLVSYFCVVLLVLILHLIASNTILLRIFANLNPLKFFRKMYSAMMFAFSTSSSNVSIPVVLETVEVRLGVKNSVASFVIPLGATINMDGTAIMQGVATVFISNAYNIDIGFAGYLTVILTATLASVGTAGVPGVGLITLAMVLKQVGLPIEGIGLIIGVDRILDMVRTAVNITGDSAVACVVAKSEDSLNKDIFDKLEVESSYLKQKKSIATE